MKDKKKKRKRHQLMDIVTHQTRKLESVQEQHLCPCRVKKEQKTKTKTITKTKKTKKSLKKQKKTKKKVKNIVVLILFIGDLYLVCM